MGSLFLLKMTRIDIHIYYIYIYTDFYTPVLRVAYGRYFQMFTVHTSLNTNTTDMARPVLGMFRVQVHFKGSLQRMVCHLKYPKSRGKRGFPLCT